MTMNAIAKMVSLTARKNKSAVLSWLMTIKLDQHESQLDVELVPRLKLLKLMILYLILSANFWLTEHLLKLLQFLTQNLKNSHFLALSNYFQKLVALCPRLTINSPK